MTDEINRDEEKIEDLDAGVAADDVRGGNSTAAALSKVQSGVTPPATGPGVSTSVSTPTVYQQDLSLLETSGMPAATAEIMAQLDANANILL